MTEKELILYMEEYQNKRIEEMEKRLQMLSTELEANTQSIVLELHKISDYQKENEQVLDTLNTIAHGSIFLKWIFTSLVTIFAGLGVIFSSYELFKKWWGE